MRVDPFRSGASDVDSPYLMPIYLHHIEPVVPNTSYEQSTIRDAMKGQLGGDRKVERILGRIYGASGIQKRHSVIRDYLPGVPEGIFYDPERNRFKRPSTGERNRLYREASIPLYTCAAKRAVTHSGIALESITHVITVSCTGFFAPGPDYVIVKALELSPSTQRFHLGFMGCYAAFPALRMAKAFCEADRNATVLVVCLELCTLHLQPKEELDSLLATSVFADGAAAVVVSAKEPQGPALELSGFATTLTPTGEADMTWTVGDTGFDMVLSSYVPNLIATNLSAALSPLFEELELSAEEVDHWAVHPGGRAILDKVERELPGGGGGLTASRHVLHDYGNMSSATILFVLNEILNAPTRDTTEPELVYALAFGPGLTVESGLMVKHP